MDVFKFYFTSNFAWILSTSLENSERYYQPRIRDDHRWSLILGTEFVLIHAWSVSVSNWVHHEMKGWNTISWSFGSDDFPLQMGDF